MERALRLTESKSFSRIMGRARRISSPSFFCFIEPSDRFRVGIIVSKKVSKLAVTRNRIKRQIRHIAASTDIRRSDNTFIIIVKSSYLANDYMKNREQLLGFFSKVAA